MKTVAKPTWPFVFEFPIKIQPVGRLDANNARLGAELGAQQTRYGFVVGDVASQRDNILYTGTTTKNNSSHARETIPYTYISI